jgi:hypothetical protein
MIFGVREFHDCVRVPEFDPRKTLYERITIRWFFVVFVVSQNCNILLSA